MEKPFNFQPCPKDDRPMVEINDTHIRVIKENLKYHYNSTGEISDLDVSRVVCCYKQMRRPRRINDITSSSVDNRVIEEAQTMSSSYGHSQSLTVTVAVKPSDGRLEATMRKVDQTWQPIGTVGRLNRYGEQSHCIDVAELKLYCFCRGYRQESAT